MSDNFSDTLKDNGEGIQKIIAWLNTKFGMNKHADMVKVLNQFFSTTRMKNENLIDYIARFEKRRQEKVYRQHAEQFSS